MPTHQPNNNLVILERTSVADPDPKDPYVFGPPGSGTFNHQAQIIRKTLIPTVS
jgi:hypothetical protein